MTWQSMLVPSTLSRTLIRGGRFKLGEGVVRSGPATTAWAGTKLEPKAHRGGLWNPIVGGLKPDKLPVSDVVIAQSDGHRGSGGLPGCGGDATAGACAGICTGVKVGGHRRL